MISFTFIIIASFALYLRGSRCTALEINDISWYSYVKNFPGITIDINSYSTFKYNIQLIEKHNSASNDKWNVTPFLHIKLTDFTKKFELNNDIPTSIYKYPVTEARQLFASLSPGKYFSWVDKNVINTKHYVDSQSWIATMSQLINSVEQIRYGYTHHVDLMQLESCSNGLYSSLKYNSIHPILLDNYKREINNIDKCIPTRIEDMMKCGYNYTKLRDIDANSIPSLSFKQSRMEIYSSPIAIDMMINDSDILDLQFYGGFKILTLNCNNCKTINYSGLIVGYGKTNNGIDYWIVNMNMGEKWGTNGLLKLSPYSSSIIYSYQL